MCGFFAVLGETSDVSFLSGERYISHRGPNDHARVVLNDLSIAFYRLSINGVENGMQPFIDMEGNTLTVVNGEIYNHHALRSELTLLGANFQTESDAEVVHQGFLVWGTKVFARLEGMFAAAVYESDCRQITLARDRVGKKPLYYSRKGSTIHFGSEIAALPTFIDAMPKEVAVEYLMSDGVSWGTNQAGIPESVPAGACVQINPERSLTERFWNPAEVVASGRERPSTRRRALDSFYQIVREAVTDRLMSEVPVGVFLSGGIDSKLVTAVAAEVGFLERAYTLKFHNEQFDESPQARDFAAGLGIAHEDVVASVDSLAEMWEVLKATIDEPVADAAVLGEMLLSRAAAGTTPVVLTGDGGDEISLGYQHVLAHSVMENRLFRQPLGFAIKTVSPLLNRRSEGYFTPAFKADRFLRGAKSVDLIERDFAWRGSFDWDSVCRLVPGADQDDFKRFIAKQSAVVPSAHYFPDWRDRWSFLYLSSYLPNVILKKVDRASMRFGVEARSPLLDRRVVESALTMSPRERRSYQGAKLPILHSLRKATGRRLASPTKHGMGMPVVSLLNGPLKDEVTLLGEQSELGCRNILAQNEIHRIVREFESAPQSRVREVWSLLVFNAWAKRAGSSAVS